MGPAPDPIFELVPAPSDRPQDMKKLFVRVPMAELISRETVGLPEIATWALKTVPAEAKDERPRIANALNLIELHPPKSLTVFGPEEGDFYIELPEGQALDGEEK